MPLLDVNNHLKSLPSVQPEILACGSGELKVQPEVDEWCTDCPAYDHEKHCCPRFNRVIQETVKEIRAERMKGRWIDMGDFEQCSVCGGTHLKEFQSYYGKTKWIKTNYCPNCGVIMDGESDETD